MNLPQHIPIWSVPPIWPGETIVCLGGGPSLTMEQVDQCRETSRMIAINGSYKLARTADILYGCDSRWWDWYSNAPDFLGVRVGLAWNDQEETFYPGWENIDSSTIKFLASTGELGLEADPHGLRTGKNGGYQAINLAVHLGAKKIVLLGYDMQAIDGKHHWFPARSDHSGGGAQRKNVPNPPYDLFLPAFDSLVEPLKELEIEIYNCSPDSALTAFPMARLEEVV